MARGDVCQCCSDKATMLMGHLRREWQELFLNYMYVTKDTKSETNNPS